MERLVWGFPLLKRSAAAAVAAAAVAAAAVVAASFKHFG